MRKIILVLLLCPLASATNWYVRAGASGSNNGSNWTNAWTNVTGISWASLAAGDIVWVAGGTYANLNPQKSGATNNPIIIRRATTANHGPAVDWNNSFDAVANLSFINFSNGVGDWITIDGQAMPGFHITVPQGSGTGSVDFNGSGARHDIVFQYIDMAGPCDVSGSCTHTGNDTAFYICCGGPTNITVRYSKVHGVCTAFQWYGPNGLLEYNEIYYVDDATGANCHPDIYYTGGGASGTIRYSSVHDFSDENLLISDSTPETWYYYGNVMYGYRSTARTAEAQQTSHTLYFYNNTIDNPTNGFTTAASGSWNAASSERNNIWIGGTVNTLSGADYELCNTGSCTGSNSVTASIPFVNQASHNYNLTAHTAAGLNLGSPYNVDPNGNTRANWDRGAYEFASGGCTTPPIGSILSPVSGIVSSPVTIQVGASAVCGTVSTVVFLVNGSSIGTDSTSPYNLSWSSIPGSYTLSCTVTDSFSNSANCSNVLVTVKNSVAAPTFLAMRLK